MFRNTAHLGKDSLAVKSVTLMTTATTKAYRAALLYFVANPCTMGQKTSTIYHEDGLLVVDQGRILDIGPSKALLAHLPPETPVTHYPHALIVPGFIDTHIHYPQIDIIASYSGKLLDWLQEYVYPAEQALTDPKLASGVADAFLNELLRNGTTTALVFATSHPNSVNAFFQAAQQRQLCMIAGKVLMDRNAPDYLLDTPASAYTDSKALIERWHHQDRLLYAVTPRFAPTSTPQQLDVAAKLLREYPDVYFHTHLSENLEEVLWVKSLFPDRANYLDVYDHHGLLGKRSLFAHAVHLHEDECARLAKTDSAVAFCPTSNLFLGSGLCDLRRLDKFNVKVGIGTDVGAGTSFSLLQTLNEAYKVLRLQNQTMDPFESLYRITRGGAKALGLEHRIGSLAKSYDADFVVLDYHATPLLRYRTELARNLQEKLFALIMLGDDRVIQATYVAGVARHQRSTANE